MLNVKPYYKKDTTNIQKHIHQIVYIYMYANYSARASRSMVLPTGTRQSQTTPSELLFLLSWTPFLLPCGAAVELQQRGWMTRICTVTANKAPSRYVASRPIALWWLPGTGLEENDWLLKKRKLITNIYIRTYRLQTAKFIVSSFTQNHITNGKIHR